MKKYLIPFQNVKTNVWVFCILAIASVMGTLIPQLSENPDGVREFVHHSPQLGALMNKLYLFNIYTSWWFIGLLGLMAFNVVVCKLIFGKFPGVKNFKENEKNSSVFSTVPFKTEWSSRTSLEITSEKIKEQLKSNKYRIGVKKLEDGSVLLFGVKHPLQRLGSWVSHISILVILLANLTGALYGFKEVLSIPEGNSVKMEKRDWVVTCDQFIVDWYPGTNTPKTFASDLRLFENGRMAAEESILVNEPLEYKKVRFYQATYGPYLKEARLGIFLRTNPKKSPTVTLKLNEEVSVPGTPYSLRILEFIPNFSLNEKQEIVSRSARPENPALQVLVSRNGKPIKAPWVFERFPTIQMPPIQKEDEFILLLAEYIHGYSTGIQVSYDPGADLFWIGCTILVLGLMTLFYLHHRKFWVWLRKDSEGTYAWAGATSSRGKSFEAEFIRLTDSLKQLQ